jgi:hypothetical protein
MKKYLFVIFLLCSAWAYAQDMYDNAELVTRLKLVTTVSVSECSN